MPARPLCRALVPLVAVAVIALAPGVAGADPPPSNDGSSQQTPAEGQPQPPVDPQPPVEPTPSPLPLPGRAVECDVVTAPVPQEQTVIASGIRVHPCLASRVTMLVEAAAREAVTLRGGGWRSHQRQIELRRAHCGTSDFAIWEMPAGRCKPPTARPGRSRHERGLAIDFNNCSTRTTACYQWLDANAAGYGLYNLPSEPWHWSVDGH